MTQLIDTATNVKTMPKKTAKKGSIMDAVTALATLGDEEEEEVVVEEEEKVETKQDGEEEVTTEEVAVAETGKVRYIPEHKKPDAALTFPEKLMNMMNYADQFKDDEKYSIAWIPDGKSFVIRNPDVFTRQVLPKFFKATKFQSFTRKLYRWGFRQVNRGIGPDDPIIFGNEYFQRDDEELMVKMRSVTAAANRRRGNDPLSGRKRSLEELDEQRRRILMDRLVAENAAMGGDPRYMAQYAAMMRFPPGGMMPPGMPPMMMQRFGPPGMFNMQQPTQGEGGEQGEGKQEEGGEGGEGKQEGEGGDAKQPATPQQPPTPQGEKEIIDSAVAALKYAA